MKAEKSNKGFTGCSDAPRDSFLSPPSIYQQHALNAKGGTDGTKPKGINISSNT
jgi:hypothetical protein